jgi:hypothetical protein
MQRGNHELLGIDFDHRRARIAGNDLAFACHHSRRDPANERDHLTACGSDERPCQVAAHRGQIELGEIMVRTRTSDGFSCGYSRYNPCWIKASGEDELN